MRSASSTLKKVTGEGIPLDKAPVKFGSWMGGDRDGNPNVTHKVTECVNYLARWLAADLYIRDIDHLRFELSMPHCSEELAERARQIEQAMHDFPDHYHYDRRREEPSATSAGIASGQNDEHVPCELTDMPDEAMNALQEYKRGFNAEAAPQDLNTMQKETSQSSLSSTDSRDGKEPYSLRATKHGQSQSSQGQQLGSGYKKGAKSEGNKKLRSNVVDAMLNPRFKGATPYRVVLGDIRQKLINTRRRMEDLLAGVQPHEDEQAFEEAEELMEPLKLCYRRDGLLVVVISLNIQHTIKWILVIHELTFGADL